jgi:TfoX/Sxy family transcriptional regulator of competence genes
MAWKDIPPELIEFMDRALAPYLLERRKMFGCAIYMLNGHIFAGLDRSDLWVRLSDEDRAQFLASVPGAAPFEPLREYVVVPPAVYRDEAAFERWLQRGLEYTRSLPAKEAKPRKRRMKDEG